MKATPQLKWLRLPAYGLYYVDSLEQSARGDYSCDIVPTFHSRFDAAAQQSILKALAWAAEGDVFDWEEVLPGLPHSGDFKRQHCRITRDRILRLLAT